MKKLTAIICLVFAIVMVLSLPMSISASEPYQTYTYSISGTALGSACPARCRRSPPLGVFYHRGSRYPSPVRNRYDCRERYHGSPPREAPRWKSPSLRGRSYPGSIAQRLRLPGGGSPRPQRGRDGGSPPPPPLRLHPLLPLPGGQQKYPRHRGGRPLPRLYPHTGNGPDVTQEYKIPVAHRS